MNYELRIKKEGLSSKNLQLYSNNFNHLLKK